VVEVEVRRPLHIKVNGKKQVVKEGRIVLTEDDLAQWYIPGLFDNGSLVSVEEVDRAKQSKRLNYRVSKITLGEVGRISDQSPESATGGSAEPSQHLPSPPLIKRTATSRPVRRKDADG